MNHKVGALLILYSPRTLVYILKSIVPLYPLKNTLSSYVGSKEDNIRNRFQKRAIRDDMPACVCGCLSPSLQIKMKKKLLKEEKRLEKGISLTTLLSLLQMNCLRSRLMSNYLHILAESLVKYGVITQSCFWPAFLVSCSLTACTQRHSR